MCSPSNVGLVVISLVGIITLIRKKKKNNNPSRVVVTDLEAVATTIQKKKEELLLSSTRSESIHEKRFAFTTTVKDGMMQSYTERHDQIFPEVAAGLRLSGVRDLLIFREPGSSRLFMYIVMYGNQNLGDQIGAGSKYRNPTYNKRIIEWESLMETHFEGGKWTSLEEIHSSDFEWNVALNAIKSFTLSSSS